MSIKEEAKAINLEELNKALKTSKELVENLEKANSLLQKFANRKDDIDPKINPTGKIKSKYDVLEILIKTLEELRERQEQLSTTDLTEVYLLITEKVENLSKFLLEF